MEYATRIDVGDRKREDGINEDSVAVSVFEHGHRDGTDATDASGEGATPRGTAEGSDSRAPDAEDGEGRPPGSDATADGPTGNLFEASESDGVPSDGSDPRSQTVAPDGREAAGSPGGDTAERGDTADRSDAADRGDVVGPEADTEGRAGVEFAPKGAGDGPVEGISADRAAGVFALADGAGGHDSGDVASYLAATVAAEQLAGVAIRAARADAAPFDVTIPDAPERPDAEELRAAIEGAIVAAHREILRYAAENDRRAHTTLVAGIVVDGEVHVGWVGDSRAYLVNHELGRIERLTRDHNVVSELEMTGQIDDVEAKVHPRGNEITRALGGGGQVDPDTATVEVDTRTVPMYADDDLLVTSDGLIDAQTDAPELYDQYVESGRDDEVAATVRDRVVTDPEIRDAVLQAEDLEAANRRLVALANERGGKDNLSTIMVREPTFDPTPETPTDRSVGDVEDRETVIVKE